MVSNENRETKTAHQRSAGGGGLRSHVECFQFAKGYPARVAGLVVQAFTVFFEIVFGRVSFVPVGIENPHIVYCAYGALSGADEEFGIQGVVLCLHGLEVDIHTSLLVNL